MKFDTVAVGDLELSDAEMESIHGGMGPWGHREHGEHRHHHHHDFDEHLGWPFFEDEEDEWPWGWGGWGWGW